ncbi:MAG TPA: AAA family ATPase [Alphaproteobacteria bacterium]|nr:AAA family ATPase [Alphaproteobacteria bacterium]
MRIGISGSAGTGKTTLATELARRLGLPFKGEAMRERLAAGFDLHAITPAEHRALIAADAEGFAPWLADPSGAVTDRTPLDMLAFWLANGYAHDDPPGTARLAERAAALCLAYDLVAVLPWGALPLAADGVRSVNPWHQLHLQAVAEGVLARFLPPGRLLVLPSALLDVGARRDHILGELERMR